MTALSDGSGAGARPTRLGGMPARFTAMAAVGRVALAWGLVWALAWRPDTHPAPSDRPSPPSGLSAGPDTFLSCAPGLAFAESPLHPVPGWFRRLGGERRGAVDWPRFRADAALWFDQHPEAALALLRADAPGADPAPGPDAREAFLRLARRRFDRLDANHDGRIGREEAYASALRETESPGCAGRD